MVYDFSKMALQVKKQPSQH